MNFGKIEQAHTYLLENTKVFKMNCRPTYDALIEQKCHVFGWQDRPVTLLKTIAKIKN